jgi:hypothetical protein
MIPEHKLAIIVLSNRNGGIFFGPERAILDQLLAPAPSPASTPPSGAMRRGARAEFAGVYVSGRDTLRFTRRGDSLFYRYAQNEESRTRAEGDSTILILNPAGEPVQQFSLVRGLRTNNVYLHDGLSAFRKLQ